MPKDKAREKDSRKSGDYALRIHGDNQKFVQELLAENERLRAEVSSLRLDKASTQADNRRFSSRYVDLEQRTNNLLNLYVASYRLHGALNRKELLEIVQEIVINLIGSEEMAVFSVNGKDGSLHLEYVFGMEEDRCRRIAQGNGIVARSVRSGARVIDPKGDKVGLPEEKNITASIPLMVEGKVVGLIAIFTLLAQKPGIEELDHELFDLLANQAAVAFYCAGLHETAERSNKAAC